MRKFALLCLSLFTMNLSADCLLRSTQYLETDASRTEFGVADFNRDGFLDLAVAGSRARVIKVFLNQGDGNFEKLTEKKLKSSPHVFAVSDFNRDEVPDLAVGTGASVEILMNDGSGKFAIKHRIRIQSEAIAAGDFNADGAGDLAVISKRGSNGALTIFLNAHDSFRKSQTLPVKSPIAVLAVPLGKAGAIDLIVANEGGNLLIYKGSGPGIFQEAAAVRGVEGANVLKAGLLNDDELIDLVVGGRDGKIAVFIGENETEFRRIQLSTERNVRGLALGDFNADKRIDLAVVNESARAFLYAGNGKGGFSLARSLAFGIFIGPIASGDFNRDGNIDLVIAESGSAGIFMGNGKNNFTTGLRTLMKEGGNIFAGDFDADGNPDLIVSGTNRSVLLKGKGNGSFNPPAPIGLPQIGYGTVSDFNKDGRDDLAGFEQFTLKTWITTENTEFIQTTSVRFSIDPPVQALDLNGDSLLDIAVIMPGRLIYLLNQGNGKFGPARGTSLSGHDRGTLADFNSDGIPDLATIRDNNPRTLSIFLGNPDLEFTRLTKIPLRKCPGAISAGDANGDGKTDLVIGTSCNLPVQLFIGDGTGSFSRGINAEAGSGSFNPLFADFNNDKSEELYAIARNLGKLSISVAPEFRDYRLFGPYYWDRVAVADFDRDGHRDVVISSFNSTALILNCE